MYTVEEIRRLKEERGYTNERLSELSGVPLGTVQKVLGNVTRAPRYDTMKALSSVFEDHPGPSLLRDAGVAYAVRRPHHPALDNWNYYERQGTYTIDDYLALPEEQRVELIDGVIYDMGAPRIEHQLIGGMIFNQIHNFVRGKGGPCIPFMSPVDVQLDCDGRTVVQPDVGIVCDRSLFNEQRVFGAPDFVAEVLSPSTKNKDMLIKSGKYQRAGVREYWLVDPKQETVTVFEFGEEIVDKRYTFEDKVPVGIYEGECEVDFKDIKDYISFLYQPRPAGGSPSAADGWGDPRTS